MNQFTVLDSTPLFTLILATPEPAKFTEIFPIWPSETISLLNEAQEARDKLSLQIKNKGSNTNRLAALDKYLPIISAIEKERNENPKIGDSKEKQFRWRQTPLVVDKFVDRSFPGGFVNVETLHVIWLKAVLLVNQASDEFKNDHLEVAATTLRTAAGIFQYLAADRCRVTEESSLPIEFQPPVFNSFMSLALAQVYAIIATKGERDGTSHSALGKICYTVSNTFSTAFDAIKTVKDPAAFHIQYVNWLEQAKLLYHAASCAFFAQSQYSRDEPGMALGLARLAITELEKSLTINKVNKLLNEAATNLLEKIRAAETRWKEQNFLIYSQPVADENAANRFVASNVLTTLNLPQPTQYSPPEPTIPKPEKTAPQVKKLGPAKDGDAE